MSENVLLVKKKEQKKRIVNKTVIEVNHSEFQRWTIKRNIPFFHSIMIWNMMMKIMYQRKWNQVCKWKARKYWERLTDICVKEGIASTYHVLRANGKLPASHSYAWRSKFVLIIFFFFIFVVPQKCFRALDGENAEWWSERVREWLSEWVCVWMNRLIYFYLCTYFNFDFKYKIHSIAIASNIIITIVSL